MVAPSDFAAELSNVPQVRYDLPEWAVRDDGELKVGRNWLDCRSLHS
jgi:hypothetical protein